MFIKIIQIIFCTFFTLCSAQHFRFTYEYKFSPNISKKDSVVTDYMNLDSDGHQSIFYNATKFEIDSAYAAGGGFNVLANAKHFDQNLNYEITKNYDSKEINFYSKLNGINIKIKEPILPIWTLTNEFKEINHYSCQKALTNYKGREWIAWFTQDISIADGPYKFYNLPGFIVAVHDKELTHSFELIQIKKINNLYKTNIKNAKLITSEQFKKLNKNKINMREDVDFINISNNSNMTIVMKDGYIKNLNVSELAQFHGDDKKVDEYIAKQLQKTSNPIELDK